MDAEPSIEDAIEPLVVEGWSIERIDEYPDAAGSREIVLSKGEIGARLVSHHGRVFADVGFLGARGGWYNLNDVLSAAGEAVSSGPLASLEEAVGLLKGAAPRVGAYLENPTTMSRLGVRWTAPSGDRARK
jgi:hypothetical protein